MKTLKIFGASDDLVELRGAIEDEFCDVSGVFQILVGGSSGLVIQVFYVAHDEPVWSIAVSQVDEDTPIPDWPIRIVQCDECDYSAMIEIDLPDEVISQENFVTQIGVIAE